MICDNNRHTKTFAVVNLFTCGNSIITSNDCIHTLLVSPVNQVTIESITILHTIRNITVNLSA